MADGATHVGRVLVVLAATVVAGVVGWVLFVGFPTDLAELFGVLLVVGTVLYGARLGSRIASQRFPDYNVAEVAVEGPISRDGSPGSFPARPGGASADEIVDLIESADADDHAEALLVKLDTPGGAVVPSDDIRHAAAAFDGPTIAYTTDVCASGGYWIASGCDELWARDASIVGSIGVIGSRPNVSELADQLGVSYERFAAGKYKDAGQPLKKLSEDERAYLQGIIDDYYENFVERVAEGRDMDPAAIRDTEARVYLGEEALALGLVDHLGARDDVERRVEDLLGEEVSVSTFEPQRGLTDRLRGGAATVAFALGAGVASAVSPDDGFDFRL
ncbi:protease-4 [Halogranum amylolyticum]|uniref:Protease-4 n=1 Tax=Halogranum amylolyticum TaxID=660520 RepID=A0A1H8PD28_9EURY|nr:signal peptide peptidase SppA [Halogranum amylolyticum]SEO39726.1 protease-4 [Halogranum amylolyticum]